MKPAALTQLTLLGGSGPPGFDAGFERLTRRQLAHGAWVDYAPEWVHGHEALFEHLASSTRWHQESRQMYERKVEVPRLIAGLPADGPGHPVLESMRQALSARYRTEFVRTGMGFYRDGNDSVAWHGDYVARELPEAVVATVSLGAPRRFLLREAAGGGTVRRTLEGFRTSRDGLRRGKPSSAHASLSYELGWGDLIVMGGSCQRTYRHCVPKVARAEPRLSVMFRPIWEPPPGFRGRTGY
jgi:alkylated DNA repair dioxygenase AlkB